jgi:hypothetical protein
MRAAIEALERAEEKPITGLASTALLERLLATRDGNAPLTIEESAIETGSIAAPRDPRPGKGVRRPR